MAGSHFEEKDLKSSPKCALVVSEVRCRKCNHLFFKGNIDSGNIEAKCKNCGYINKFSFVDAVGNQRLRPERRDIRQNPITVER